jgi:hypothetical protein
MLVPMQRTLVLGAAWLGSAAAAVGLGFLAVSLVGASASPAPVSAAGTTTSAQPAPPSGAPSASGEQATAGGTVYASCAAGAPDVASAPAAGWSVDDSSEPGKVEFRSGTARVEVRVTCAGGAPQFSVEDRTATSPSVPAGPSATEDSGGGHGSDDPPGDDSSGRGGGGHGSDG